MDVPRSYDLDMMSNGLSGVRRPCRLDVRGWDKRVADHWMGTMSAYFLVLRRSGAAAGRSRPAGHVPRLDRVFGDKNLRSVDLSYI